MGGSRNGYKILMGTRVGIDLWQDVCEGTLLKVIWKECIGMARGWRISETECRAKWRHFVRQAVSVQVA